MGHYIEQTKEQVKLILLLFSTGFGNFLSKICFGPFPAP